MLSSQLMRPMHAAILVFLPMLAVSRGMANPPAPDTQQVGAIHMVWDIIPPENAHRLPPPRKMSWNPGGGGSITRGYHIFIGTEPLTAEKNNYVYQINMSTWQDASIADLLKKDVIYFVNVDAYNEAGSSPFASITVPTAPRDLTVLTLDSNRVDLSMEPSRDHVAIAAYLIYREGILIGHSSSTFFSDTEVVPGAEYLYTACAANRTGSKSAIADPIIVRIPIPGGDPPPAQRIVLQDPPPDKRVVASTNSKPRFRAKPRPSARSFDISVPEPPVLFPMFDLEGIGVGDVERVVKEGFRTLSGGDKYFRIPAQVRAHQMKLQAVAEAIRSKFTKMDRRVYEAGKEELAAHAEDLAGRPGSDIVRDAPPYLVSSIPPEKTLNTEQKKRLPLKIDPSLPLEPSMAELPAIEATREIPIPDVWKNEGSSNAALEENHAPDTNASALSPRNLPDVIPQFTDKTSFPLAEDIVFKAKILTRKALSNAVVDTLTRRFSEGPSPASDSQSEPQNSGIAKNLYISASLLALGVLLRRSGRL